MREKESIEINFSQALQAADALEEAAENLKKIIKEQLADSLQGAGSIWKSDAAQVLLKKGFALRQTMMESAVRLGERADKVREAAARVYEAEKRAVIMAGNRKY